MNIESIKLELIHLLLQTREERILNKIKGIFEEEKADWWNEMSKKEQEEIKNGLAQADREEYKTHQTVMKRFNKWH